MTGDEMFGAVPHMTYCIYCTPTIKNSAIIVCERSSGDLWTYDHRPQLLLASIG
jgi:hypothetical protein